MNKWDRYRISTNNGIEKGKIHGKKPQQSAPKSHIQTFANSLVQLSALEINVTEHCNLQCKGCDHAMGIIPKRKIALSAILTDIRKAAKIMHVRTIRIIGGEPLLHPELPDILRDIKSTAIADSLELWTNGKLLNEISQDTLDYVDGVIISKYPKVNYNWDFSLLNEYANKYNVWFHVRNCNHFAWNSLSDKISNPALVKMLHANCREAATCHTLRKGKFYKCVQAAFASDRLLAAEVEILDDGVQLHNNPSINEEIESHLWSNVPLQACYYCLGEFGAYFPHENWSDKSFVSSEHANAGFDPQLILPDSLI